MADILVTYSELKQLDEQLKSIIAELRDSTSRADALERAIGEPYGKKELRDAAQEFEEGWDDRRSALAEDLAEVEKRVAGVVEGFEKWDSETASGLQASSGPSPAGPR